MRSVTEWLRNGCVEEASASEWVRDGGEGRACAQKCKSLSS